jgi:3-hydroxybutyryl-CoA dehydrogenase
MENVGYMDRPVLIAGEGKLAFSIAVCLLQAGHKVTLYTSNGDQALRSINVHCADLKQAPYRKLKQSSFEIVDHLDGDEYYGLAIAITNEDASKKRSIIQQLERILSTNTVIAINVESISLSVLQKDALYPERIIGANWSESAHTTLFLELIANENTGKQLAADFFQQAKLHWKKDPYIVSGDSGIRSKMLSAIAREAFFLVENGYASIEDIDRACRNDPGYYLSFAGNFRYMDLMGACGYGEVMKDLNPELSKAKQVPEFFANIIRQGHLGMENNKGFYQYEEGDAEKWSETFRKYSYQIQEIIEKYPFGYTEDNL